MTSAGRAVGDELAMIEQRDARAELLDEEQVVRDQHERSPCALEVADGVQALALEALVADGEGLVDEDDLGIEVDRHREAEPHVHAGGVGPDRHVDEALELGEGDDRVEARRDRRRGARRAARR